MPLNADALADLVLQTCDTVHAPTLTRLAALESQLLRLAELHDRLLSLERRDGMPKELTDLRERVAVLEVTRLQPGPAGPAGADGRDGKDGTPGLRYAGVYAEGASYALGDLVTWAGTTWHCNAATTTRPGEGAAAWTLMVKRGRDGKDARP